MWRYGSINLWNRLLPTCFILAGAGIAAIGLAADSLAFGGLPGIGPRQVSLAFSGLAVLLAGVVLILPGTQRDIGGWLLVGLAAVIVAFSADLLVINGLPDTGAKLLVLSSLLLSVWSTRIVLAPTPERVYTGQWLDLSTLDRQKIGKFLGLAVQLGLLVLVIGRFRLENQAFYHNIMLVAFFGFLIHYFLPLHYRLPFFLFLSLAAVVGILGLANGVWLIGIGLGLIGICHLPIPYIARTLILLAAGLGLLALRVDWIQNSWLDVIWPVLASMFMFRLMVYLHDIKHGKAAPTLASTLSYFFLLPNVVFPFFPVVDYSTFRRTYYNEDHHHIYQKGLQWMLRGVIQLIVYRYINYYLVIAPEDVTNTAELIRYLISNFALYIRISGQFHLIIGLLHLFGFNLPETHHLYFLASSFTDLWRRINIYWKDFMMKIFYYPIYFRIRKWGPTISLVTATFLVFILTWFLHAYQWLWLRGKFLLTTPDILFWFILALFVVVNTLQEIRRPPKRTLGQRSRSYRDIASLALRSAGTFTLMAILWALWSSESVRDWIALFKVVRLDLASISALLLTLVAITVVFGLTIWIGSRQEKSSLPSAKPPAYYKSAATTGGAILVVFLIGSPVVYDRIGGKAQALISDLTANRLSDLEAAQLQRGYYEDLVGVNRFNSQLWDIYNKRPSDWPMITETEAARETGNNLIVEMVPSKTILFHGAKLSTNRWGMRDKDYEQIPAPNTYRIALTGPSFVMGFGVADDEVFEWELEERLNREQAGGKYDQYEILNFAVPAYSAFQNLMLLEQKIPAFHPDALFYMAHQREEEAVVLYLADRLSAGAELPYPDLLELARQAGASPEATKGENVRSLQPVGREILEWVYRRVVETSRSQGVLPVWIFMPTLEYPLREDVVADLVRLADDSGFIVLDLSDAYANQDPESLVVAYWDKHPNAMGHHLIAERLYQALQENKTEIPIF